MMSRHRDSRLSCTQRQTQLNPRRLCAYLSVYYLKSPIARLTLFIKVILST